MIVAVLFTKSSGQPAAGLTLAEVAIYLYARAQADGTVTTIWSGVAPTEEVGGGIYTRAYDDADRNTYDYYGYAVYSGATELDADYAVMGGAETTPAEVWASSTRTLTQSAAAVTAAVSGSDITILRGDTLVAALTGLGDLSGYVSIDFSVKGDKADTDSEAIIRIRLNASGTGDGLLRLNGAGVSDASLGSIRIDDEDAGDITVTLAASSTDDLVVRSGLYYDVQLITATAVSTLTDGDADVTGDVTRAVS